MRSRLVLLAVIFVSLALPAWGQQKGRPGNERSVEKKAHAEDRTGIWMLDFHFKDPRLISVDVPGKGKKQVWYVWYQVSNNTGAPRNFIPQFVWVCHDETGVHQDKVIPKAQQAVQRMEDPGNLLDIKNSVTISARPIPVSKEFDEQKQRIAYPKLVSGVAMWDDINPKCDRFSIFVYGLSDGWSVVDGPDGKPIYRRKTLQLKFKRLGDEFFQSSDEIRYVGHEWIYATTEPPGDAAEEKPATPSKDAGQPPSNR